MIIDLHQTFKFDIDEKRDLMTQDKLTKKKMSKTKKAILIISSLLIGFIIAFGIFATMILDTGNLVIIKVSKTNTLITEFFKYQTTGGIWVMDESDLNAIAQLVVKEGTVVGPATIKSIDINIVEEDLKVRIFAYVKGFLLRLESVVKVSENETSVMIEPIDFKVGKFQIPKNIVFDYIKKSVPSITFVDGVIIISKETVPDKLLGFSFEDSKLLLEWEKPVVIVPDPPVDPGTPTDPTPPTPPKDPAQVAKDLLIATNKQLATVESKASTQAIKSVISSIRSTISKVIADPKYNITQDVAGVKSKYGALTDSERSEAQLLILTYVNTKNLLKLQQMFNL